MPIEQTALTSRQMRASGWNTYNAGFTLVHEMSGQRIRPAYDLEDDAHRRTSWRAVARAAGYAVDDELSIGTRRIFPYATDDEKNPPISITLVLRP